MFKDDELQQKLEAKEQECEKLKDRNQYVEGNIEIFENERNELEQKCKKLKVENEKYSKALEYFLDETGIECDDEEQAIRTFRYCGTSFRKMQQDNNRYKQALDEIEKIVEVASEEYRMPEREWNSIQDIINKTKKGN